MKVHYKTVWGMVPASDVGRSGEDLNTRPIFLSCGCVCGSSAWQTRSNVLNKWTQTCAEIQHFCQK